MIDAFAQIHAVKVEPYSLSSVGPGADPGVQAVSLQVSLSHPRLYAAITSDRLVVTIPAKQRHIRSTSTRLYCLVQRHIGVNNVPKVVTQLCPSVN